MTVSKPQDSNMGGTDLHLRESYCAPFLKFAGYLEMRNDC
jgi:hypothetical protein